MSRNEPLQIIWLYLCSGEVLQSVNADLSRYLSIHPCDHVSSTQHTLVGKCLVIGIAEVPVIPR